MDRVRPGLQIGSLQCDDGLAVRQWHDLHVPPKVTVTSPVGVGAFFFCPPAVPTVTFSLNVSPRTTDAGAVFALTLTAAGPEGTSNDAVPSDAFR
ncbi:hypothetical protein ACQP15_18235 [Microbispora siamensis]